MATDKVGTRATDEFMASYSPIYQPFYPLLLGKSQAYSEGVGTANMRTVTTIGDIRAKHITPKDTEIRQIAASEAAKTFKKYFLANQFICSKMQSQDGNDAVVAQVLDEHQVQMDEMVLLGEGTSAATALNNSLYWSLDSNYVLEPSAEVAKDAGGNYLVDMHNKLMATATKADRVAGRKIILFYGTLALPLFTSLYATAARPFKAVLSEVLGSGYSNAVLPAAITPSGANGWIVVNLDQVKLHYTVLPALNDQGTNDEKMYSWYNFLMGSAMVEVQAMAAIIRQPITLAA